MPSPSPSRRILQLCLAALVAGTTHPAMADPFRSPTLVDPDHRPTSLGIQAGTGPLVVLVMKGTWCPVCVDQLGRIEDLRPTLDSLGARVVGLSPDAPDDNQSAMKQARSQYRILGDPTRTVLTELGLWLPEHGYAMPALVVFDRCGVEHARQVGRSESARPEAELLRTLQALHSAPAACDDAPQT